MLAACVSNKHAMDCWRRIFRKSSEAEKGAGRDFAVWSSGIQLLAPPEYLFSRVSRIETIYILFSPSISADILPKGPSLSVKHDYCKSRFSWWLDIMHVDLISTDHAFVIVLMHTIAERPSRFIKRKGFSNEAYEIVFDGWLCMQTHSLHWVLEVRSSLNTTLESMMWLKCPWVAKNL